MANSDKSVFIVEDAVDIQALLASLLKTEGYTVDCAKNGEEALTKLRASEKLPGLVLLDLMMPVMDGYEFRRQQEKDPRLALIPVVIMTADGDVQIKAMQVGAKGYLKKPFSNLDAILDTIAHNFSNS